MSKSDTWKRRKILKREAQEEYMYCCRDVNFWDCDKLDSSKMETVTASFKGTEGGRQKMHNFVDEYSRKHWHVSVIYTRVKK